MKPSSAQELRCDKCGATTTEGLTPGRINGGTHVAASGGRGYTCGTWRLPLDSGAASWFPGHTMGARR